MDLLTFETLEERELWKAVYIAAIRSTVEANAKYPGAVADRAVETFRRRLSFGKPENST